MFRKIFARNFISGLKMWLIFAAVTFGGGLLSAILIATSGFSTGNDQNALGASIFYPTAMLIGFECIAVLPIANVVLIAVRYSGDFFGKKGYLTFMLPVRRRDLYFSKVLCGCVYVLMTYAVSALSIALIVFSVAIKTPYQTIMNEISYFITIPDTIQVADVILLSLVSVASNYLLVVFIYEIITGFNLNLRARGGKRVALTVVFTAVGAYVAFILLYLSLFAGGTSLINKIIYLSPAARSALPTLTLVALLAAELTLSAIFTLRSLHLVENRLNLR